MQYTYKGVAGEGPLKMQGIFAGGARVVVVVVLTMVVVRMGVDGG